MNLNNLNSLFADEDKSKVREFKQVRIHIKNKRTTTINAVEDKLLGILSKSSMHQSSMYQSPAGICENNIYAGVIKEESKKKKSKKVKKEEYDLAKLLGITVVKDRKKVERNAKFKDLSKLFRYEVPSNLFPAIGVGVQYYEDEKVCSILNKHNIPIHHPDLQRLFLRLYVKNRLLSYLSNKKNIKSLLVRIGRQKVKPKIDTFNGIRCFILTKQNENFPTLTFKEAKKVIWWLDEYKKVDSTLLAAELPSNFEWIDEFMLSHNVKMYERKRKGFYDLKKFDQRIGFLRIVITNLNYFDV